MYAAGSNKKKRLMYTRFLFNHIITHPGVFDFTIYLRETETPNGALLGFTVCTPLRKLYFAGDGTSANRCFGNRDESLARNPIPLRLLGCRCKKI